LLKAYSGSSPKCENVIIYSPACRPYDLPFVGHKGDVDKSVQTAFLFSSNANEWGPVILKLKSHTGLSKCLGKLFCIYIFLGELSLKCTFLILSVFDIFRVHNVNKSFKQC